MRNSVFARIIVTLLFSLVCGYFGTVLLRVLITQNNDITGYVLDYEGTIQFILNETVQNQLVILLLVAGVFIYMFSKLNKGKKQYEDASDFGVHGTARWGKFEEVIDGIVLSKKNKYKKKNPVSAFKTLDRGIILGKVPNKNELLILPDKTKVDNRNVLVVGSSGSGKGQSYVLPNLINNTHESMIVTDPKGELYRDTAHIKRDQGYKVYQIDFINFTQGGYNPLDYVLDDQDAQNIAKTIARNSAKDGKEDFFAVEGQRLLTALIVYCKAEYGDKANIPEHVIGLFNKIAKDEEYLDKLLEKLDPSHPAYNQLRSATVAEGKTRASIMATFTQQTGIFTINKVAKMTKKSTFNFYDFQKQKSILYVKLPMDDNPFLPLTATFFDQLITMFYKMADQQPEKRLKIPTIFLLDEFANIGKIEKYGRVLATCRGLGIGMSTIVQDLGQLESLYGKEEARSIISNHDTTIFLRTKDQETAKYFSTLAGSTTVKMDTSSRSQSGGSIFSKNFSTSKSSQEQYVKRELVTEGELLSIERDKSYVFISGYHPFATEKAWQFNIWGDLLDNYSKYRPKLLKITDVFNPLPEEVVHTGQGSVTDLLKDDDEVDTTVGEQNIENNLVNDVSMFMDKDESEPFTADDLEEMINNPAYLKNEQEQEETIKKLQESEDALQQLEDLFSLFEEETEGYEENKENESVTIEPIAEENEENEESEEMVEVLPM